MSQPKITLQNFSTVVADIVLGEIPVDEKYIDVKSLRNDVENIVDEILQNLADEDWYLNKSPDFYSNLNDVALEILQEIAGPDKANEKVTEKLTETLVMLLKEIQPQIYAISDQSLRSATYNANPETVNMILGQ